MASNSKFEIEASLRKDIGKGASRRLRCEEKLPAVIYGGGKETASLTLDHKKTARSLEIEAFYSRILTIKIDGESERVILKDVQRHPYKPQILHVDFQRVRADEKLHMHVPLHFKDGENIPGVKAGGVVSHLMNDVEISCFPDDLPEYLEVDISQLELNQTLHLSDIPIPKGVEITALTQGRNSPIVAVHIPRIIEEAPVPTAEELPSAEVPAIEQKAEKEGEEPKEEEK